jgi:hypothetical protein
MRPQPLIPVTDVPHSSGCYQELFGCQSGHGGDEYEGLLPPSRPYGNGVALWFEVDAFQSAVRRAELFGAEVVRLRKTAPSFRRRCVVQLRSRLVHVTPRLCKAPSGVLAELLQLRDELVLLHRLTLIPHCPFLVLDPTHGLNYRRAGLSSSSITASRREEKSAAPEIPAIPVTRWPMIQYGVAAG